MFGVKTTKIARNAINILLQLKLAGLLYIENLSLASLFVIANTLTFLNQVCIASLADFILGASTSAI